MIDKADEMDRPARVDLALTPDFDLGVVRVRPAIRQLILQDGTVHDLEPRVMRVLVALAKANGEVLSRDQLNERCWDGRVVGDDAINRCIYQLRKLGEEAAAGAFRLETITKVGYRLIAEHAAEAPAFVRPPLSPGAAPQEVLTPRPRRAAGVSRRALLGGAALAATGSAAWWIGAVRFGDGVPREARAQFERGHAMLRAESGEALLQALAAFRQAVAIDPDFADGWGHLALALELGRYWNPPERTDRLTAEATAAADRALALDPRNGAALTAKANAIPLFGDWLTAETALRSAVETEPVGWGRDFLAHLLMNVGRFRDALSVLTPFDDDMIMMPFAQNRIATSLWVLGRSEESDEVIDAALERWPRHFVVWLGRYWLYARNGQPERALAMSADAAGRPFGIPDDHLALNDLTVRAVASSNPALVDEAMSANLAAARRGAGFAERAILFASQVDRLDEAFLIAEGFYFTRGFKVGTLREATQLGCHTPKHHRQTGFLFMPTMAAMRADPRFGRLLEETGLTSYWRRTGTRPISHELASGEMTKKSRVWKPITR